MKTNKKVLAGAMAILLATGGMTNKAFAEEDKRPYEVNPPRVTEDEEDSTIFKSQEEAERAAEKALENDPTKNNYKLYFFSGINGPLWSYELISDNKINTTDKKQEPEKQDNTNKKETEEVNKVLNDNVAKINALSELTAEEKATYETKLKEVSKDEKAMTDIIAEAQKLNEERIQSKNKPNPTKKDEDKKPEPKKEKDKTVVEENNEVGFATKEAAEKAAKEALKNDKINKSYNVSQGRDGKYYYVLSPVVEETQKKEQAKKKPVVNKNTKKAAPNPKTGIDSISSIGTLLTAVSAAYFGTKKRR